MYLQTSHPFGTIITLYELLEAFSHYKCWEERYRSLILLGEKLPVLPAILKNSNIELTGCENKVWLGYKIKSDNKLHFYGDSESRIVRGLLAIFLTRIEGRYPKELVGVDLLILFSRLGLQKNMGAGRSSGLRLMSNKVLQIAKMLSETDLSSYIDEER
ncbi:cysteine desulfurase sulfur acceptor subunit CsdE [Candidatus Erwinia haradaeae]|nr:cysteine desulfurase sulfur acceptor subunit CsdE [Candidatus Erwinia haradaeae]